MKDKEAEVYDIQFKYVVEETAHILIGSTDEETAKAAALAILKKQNGQYEDAEIVSVSIFTQDYKSPTVN